MIGKIARFPRPIQDQLNQRLETDEEAKTILSWLNSLPEVQAVLQADFDGMAVTAGNLSEHKTRGFLDWQQRQQALEFAAKLYPNTDPDQIRRNVVCMIDRELLGVRPAAQTEETEAPASLI